MGHMLVYFFEEKRKSLNAKIENTEIKEMSEVDIASHTIMIREINKNLPLEEVTKKLEKIF